MKNILVNPTSIIKYIHYPACIVCIHFIKYNVTEYDYHPFNKEIKMSKCNNFGFKDIISGNIEYELTSKCRFNKDKCTISGKYFLPIPISKN